VVKKIIFLIFIFIIVIALQKILTKYGIEFYLTQIIMSIYYTICILGLCLLMGYAGQISLGQAGFFAIGGYTSAVLTTLNLMPYFQQNNKFILFLIKLNAAAFREDMFGEKILTITPFAAFCFAIIFSAIIAFLIGIPVLKLKGHYLAMATLGVGIIIYRIVLGTQIFGCADGIYDLPEFKLFANLAISGSSKLRVQNYYIAIVILSIILILLYNLINSRIGRALRAIHTSEDAAEALGINTARYKLYVFVISAIIAAIAGSLLTHFNGGISPAEASIMKSVKYVAIVAVGGMANFYGVMFMGIILQFLSLRGYFGSFDDLIFGAILVAMMLFSSEGLFNIFKLRKKYE